ncbi:MAG TPA: hypothetical protein VF268_16750 [Gammaproteobacteria bacterium]
MSKNRIQKLRFQDIPVSGDQAPATVTATETAAVPAVWITDRAWVSGAAGALAVVLCAWWFNVTDALGRGLYVGGFQLTTNRMDTLLAALGIITISMLTVELIRLWRWDPQNFIRVDPDIRNGRYAHFLANALVNFGLNLGLLGLVILFFQTAGEYGYANNAPYYQSWFRFLDIVWYAYLIGGLPYVLLTRALKHDPDSDKRDLSALFAKILAKMGGVLLPKGQRPVFDEHDKKAARALLVKVFFAPLMTVFFVDQFPHLVGNVGYIFIGIPNAVANGSYTHSQFNNDFFNISIATIFSIDVALAWCGYVTSTRWVDNQTASAEPTVLGWLVCLLCYPPFQMYLGLYYAAPGEREVLQFPSQWAITIFTGMMLLSYFVYMSATLWFGVRFSNLTNRGIIRKGPFAIIRHPAYASKNFAWWCVMFPAILYNATRSGGLDIAILQIIGLVLMTWVYYMRALTEERHLSVDPYYREYCKQVKYRFIPGVI